METQFSNVLKIHKLTWAQYQELEAEGTIDATALYIRPNELLNIQVDSGTTTSYDGSLARNFNLASAGHTHGNITNDGKLSTASKAVITDSNKKITTGTVPVGSGGTGQTTRVNAMNALFTLGNNAITSTTNDTSAKWGALGPGYSFYSTAGQLNDQPQQYGFVLNIPSDKSAEVFQIWHNQPSGNMYHRGGNNSNWSGTWRCLLDSSNYKAYLLDSIYPVGSIYMSVNSTSPASFLGGTWVQLKDRFLLGAGDTYSNGATGGAATHTLTTSQMPSHKHLERLCTGTEQGSATIRDYNHPAARSSTSTAGAYIKSDYIKYDSSSHPIQSVFTNSQGGGAAHNNMPPYLVVYMWQRTE